MQGRFNSDMIEIIFLEKVSCLYIATYAKKYNMFIPEVMKVN